MAAARQWAENYTKRSFCSQTWRVKLPGFPTNLDWVELPRSPLVSVSSVAYLDADGANQTWSAANYSVSSDADPGRVSLAYQAVWPTARAIADSITITFVAGYGTAAQVPYAIKAAIMLQTADLYQNREKSIVGVSYVENPAACALLDNYQMIDL